MSLVGLCPLVACTAARTRVAVRVRRGLVGAAARSAGWFGFNFHARFFEGRGRGDCGVAPARDSPSETLRAFHTMKRRCYLSDLTSTTCHALIRAPPTNQADKIKAMPELPNERGRGRITKAVSTILSNEAHSVLPVEILGRDNRVLGLEFRHPALKFRLSSTAERARQS